MSFFVYILYSEKFDKFYKGQTKDINERFTRHNLGKVKSTSPYLPWKLAWSCQKSSRSEAVILEIKLKNLSKQRTWDFIKKYS